MKTNGSPRTFPRHVLGLLLAAAACPGVLAAEGISLNFQGNSAVQVSGTAGVVPLPNWNNVTGGASVSPVALADSTGAPSGATAAYSSNSGGYSLANGGTSEDARLFVGQIIEQSTGNAQVTVSGIPYPQYDVYVYYGHGPAHAGNSMQLAADATAFIGRNEDLKTYTDPIVFKKVATMVAPGDTGNYVVFEGMTGAVFSVTQSYVTASSGIAGLQIVKAFVDSDEDGLEDGWEMAYFHDLDETDTGDPDTDDSTNAEEQARGTNPTLADTDGDGLKDGAESGTGSWVNALDTGTDPLDPDTDDDGLPDGAESNSGTFVDLADTGTHPLLTDSDGDHIADAAEIRRERDPTSGSDTPALPNVILILADDLGWGETGAYGQTKILTPNIDRLAAEGMKFTQFYAPAPVCAPTRCQLMTGKHSGQAYIRNNRELSLGYQLPLPAGTFTLGRLFQQAGYATACIGKWGLGSPTSTGAPWQQGFDHFFGYLGQVQAHHYYPSRLWRNDVKAIYSPTLAALESAVLDVPGAVNDTGFDNLAESLANKANNGNVHSHDAMTAEALAWVTQHRDRPFFLYLAYPIPHVSIQPPAHIDDLTDADGLVFDNTVRTAVEEFYPGQPFGAPIAHAGSGHYTATPDKRHEYAAMISAMDRDIGRLLALLDGYGLTDDTLIIFTSDNGTTYLGEVDYVYFNSLGGLRGYKGNLYEGGIREAFIARWPGRVPAGTTSPMPGMFDDLMPTLAELIDENHPADVTGRSILPTLLGRDPSLQEPRDTFYWEFKEGGNWTRALRKGDWKLRREYDTGTGAVTYELYDLAADPAESVNRASSEPAVVNELQRLMDVQHAPAEYFHRDADEFPVSGGVSVTYGTLGIRLDGAGYATTPLAEDVAGPLMFKAVIDPSVIAGRATQGGFLFGAGSATSGLVRVEVSQALGGYRILHGADQVLQPFAPGDVPARRFDLEIDWDPASATVTVRDPAAGVQTNLMLSAPPAAIGHVGYQVDNGITDFAPAVLCLPLDNPLRIEGAGAEADRFRFNYRRRAGEADRRYDYGRATDGMSWAPFLPLRDQPRTRFGAVDATEVEALSGNQPRAFFRVEIPDI